MNIDKNLQSVLKIYLDKYSDNTYTFIADKLIEDGEDCGKSHRTLRRYLSIVDNDSEISSDDSGLTEGSVEVPLYRNDEFYDFDGFGRISYKTVDEVFCAYSRQGLNYTREQIVQALGISETLFSLLSLKLHLSKDSAPLGPKSNELDEEMKSKRLVRITNNLLDKFVDTGNPMLSSLVRKYKKITIEAVSNTSQKIALFDSINTQLAKLLPVSYKPIPYQDTVKRLYVVIADQHFGMETGNYNTGIAQEKMRDLADLLVGAVDPDVSITLLMLGDLIHSVSGTNHPDTWKTLEQDMWGATAIIKPFEIMLEFITSIPNINEVYGVGGNHSRLSASKKEENSDEGEKLIYYMLQRALPFTVEFDPDEVIIPLEKTNFILQHGDRSADKRSGRDIAWDTGDPTKYNFILQGHTHSRQINKNDDSINYRKMVAPSFCPSDSYATGLGYKTLPGVLMISLTADGYPVVTDYPIKY